MTEEQTSDRSDDSLGIGLASAKNSDVPSEENQRGDLILDDPLKYIPDAPVNTGRGGVIENVLLDVRPPAGIPQQGDVQSRAHVDFYGDPESEGPGDRYFYGESDRRQANDVELPLYEELKNVYDWPEVELKSGPRLRGDQRLRYESDDKLDTKPSQLQSSGDRLFGSDGNDEAQRRLQHSASWTMISPSVRSTLADSREASSSGHVKLRSAVRGTLEQGANPVKEKRAVISSQDLDETFVEAADDWRDDFDDDDDDARVKFGRALKAIDETPSRTSASETDDDLEAAEQRHVSRRVLRDRKTATSLRDDASRSQRDAPQLPSVLEDQSGDVLRGYEMPSWSVGELQRDRKEIAPRGYDTRKRQRRTRKTSKRKRKHPASATARHGAARRGARSSSSNRRSRRHHAQRPRSDASSSRSAESRRDLKKKLKKKKRQKANKAAGAGASSRSTGRTVSQKGKTGDRGLLHAAVNEEPDEKVLYESVVDRSTVKPREEDDARRKEITLLLAADNDDDESQMNVALHGELAGKIVERIFEQVRKNDRLKSVFGPGLNRNYKAEDASETPASAYPQGLNENGTNRTDTMRRVTQLLDEMILSEVQRKTCVSLSAGTRQFLEWLLEADRDEESSEEAPPTLPLIREEVASVENSTRGPEFLFRNASEETGEEDISGLLRKVRVLENLVKEYDALTAREKIEVQTVHDYLVEQVNQLLRYIEAREATEARGKGAFTGAARDGTGSVVQYQSTMPNASNENSSMTKDRLTRRHREARSLDRVVLSTRASRRDEKHRKNGNRLGKPKRKHGKKHGGRGGRTEASPKRRKRANPYENYRDSPLHLAYEEPAVYDSFRALDAELTERRKRKRKRRTRRKAKRETVDKENAEAKSDRMLNLLPIKGKNRLEDEVILLNKREAWRRANEEQLEEVAFGKDMRNGTRKGMRERFGKLTEADKRKPTGTDEASSRMKREEDTVRDRASTFTGADRSNRLRPRNASGTVDGGGSREGPKGKSVKKSGIELTGKQDKLEWIEQEINVFATGNATEAAVGTGEERLATNAESEGGIESEPRAVTSYKAKINNASPVNSTPRISHERPTEVPEAEKESDKAAKLNRMAGDRSDEADPAIELRNLRRDEDGVIRGAVRRRGSIYDDDNNLVGNKLREKYTAKLEEPGDPDTDAENNLVLLRLRSDERSSDAIGWGMTPVIKELPYYYDDRASPRLVGLTERDTPALTSLRAIDPDAHVLNNPALTRLRRRGRRNGVLDVAPVLRAIDYDDDDDDDDESFPLEFQPRTGRASNTIVPRNPRIARKIFLGTRRLTRPSNSGRSNGLAEIAGAYRVLREPYNRAIDGIFRTRYDPESLGRDRAIYGGVRARLPPLWRYQYYDDLADRSSFRLAPDILGRNGDVYRYPAGAYLQERGSFKARPCDTRRSAVGRRSGRRIGTSVRVVDFPPDNSANVTSDGRTKRRK